MNPTTAAKTPPILKKKSICQRLLKKGKIKATIISKILTVTKTIAMIQNAAKYGLNARNILR